MQATLLPAAFTHLVMLLLLTWSLAGIGCKNKTSGKDEPVARINNTYIYQSELKNALGININPTDSAQLAKQYLETTLKRKALLQEAQTQMANNLPNIEQQVQDYRESLLLHAFEQFLLKQYTDTTVTQQEITAYYLQNQNNFTLKTNVVKAAYAIVNKGFEKKDSLKMLLKKADSLAIQQLQGICAREAINCSLPYQWIEWQNLQQQIPLDEADFITATQNRLYQTSDAVNTYYLSIQEWGKAGSISPPAYCQPEIEKIIVHKRRLRYLQDTKDRLFREATDKGTIEIFRQ
ncbi:MAG TPA: hypothetical protein PK239_00105 [Chitinophagales bacterium]|nr:hypothetical protein [Chitinophagales bacterium]